MLRTFGVALVALAFVSPAFAADKELPKDLAALQGKWKMVKANLGGNETPADELAKRPLLMEIKDDVSITTSNGKEEKPVKIKVDSSKTPMEIDADSPDEGKILGIYKIEKDTLTICLNLQQKIRPTKFEGKEVIVMVLEKVK